MALVPGRPDRVREQVSEQNSGGKPGRRGDPQPLEPAHPGRRRGRRNRERERRLRAHPLAESPAESTSTNLTTAPDGTPHTLTVLSPSRLSGLSVSGGSRGRPARSPGPASGT